MELEAQIVTWLNQIVGRSYLLDRCFFSSPDGLWRRAGDKTVARIERRHDGFVVIARAAWEMQH